MDSEILKVLEQIRGYVFITMAVFVIWFSLKIIESIQKIVIGYKKVWDTRFENRMEKLMDIGDYDKVIVECKEVLDSHPNHIDAVWYTAKANYYKGNIDQSIDYFDKAIYLVPSWKETASVYINELKTANNSSNLTGANNAPSS